MSEREKRLAEREAKKKDTGENTCPHGMTFGKDNLEKDCCNEDDCSCYDACEKEYDRLNG